MKVSLLVLLMVMLSSAYAEVKVYSTSCHKVNQVLGDLQQRMPEASRIDFNCIDRSTGSTLNRTMLSEVSLSSPIGLCEKAAYLSREAVVLSQPVHVGFIKMHTDAINELLNDHSILATYSVHESAVGLTYSIKSLYLPECSL